MRFHSFCQFVFLIFHQRSFRFPVKTHIQPNQAAPLEGKAPQIRALKKPSPPRSAKLKRAAMALVAPFARRHPFLCPASTLPQLFDRHIAKVIINDFLRRHALLRHGVGAPLRHPHAMPIALSGHDDPAVLHFQARQQG